VARFLPDLISSFTDIHVYFELCDSHFYHGHHSSRHYVSDDPHRDPWMRLNETSFPPAGYFFGLVCMVLDLVPLTYDQYLSIIHRHFYSPTQNKLYPLDLIVRNMATPVVSSIFGFEDLPQDVFSVILSYMDISSVRTMLPVSNVFYFKIRDSLTCCHESVFEMYRISFIEQLLPLFTLIKLCHISTKSVDHALDPLSIFNTFESEWLKNHPFVQQFKDLIYGLYPLAPCISTREYYYLLHSFILSLLPSTISHTADPLKPFEQTILSNKFTFDHFHGYMNSILPLMEEPNLTGSDLGLAEFSLRYRHSHFIY
jgi:hypothetical protein